jgi:FAD/FMN-containing dehydrogenase
MLSSSIDAAALAHRVRGPVLRPVDENFAGELAGFNLAVQHRPAMVVGAMDAADVAATVTWAAAHGLPVAVQATGHGQTHPIDGGVLITTRRLADVSIDVAARTARVGAGVIWRQVIEAAAEHGLAPLNGSSSGVGVVGYTVGGGMGLLARRYGFAADHVRSLEVVTADGRIRTVDAEHDPDLFWALRGAGRQGFGVVTAIEFDLVEVRTLYGGGIFYAGSAAAGVLHAFRAWAPTLPEESTASVALLRLPDLPGLPEPLRGKFVVHLRYAHLGGATEGAQLLAPMRAAGPSLMDTVSEMPYRAVDSIHADPTDPMPAHDAGALLKDLPPEAVDALLAVAGPDVDVPLAMVEVRVLGGALRRQAEVPNAVSGRSGAFSVYALGPMVPGLEQVVPAVVASVVDALEPFRADELLTNLSGHTGTEGALPERRTADRERLAQIKRSYDPTGMFGAGHTKKEN